MPVLPTIWEEIKHFWNDEVKLKGGVINTMLMKDEEGTIYISAIICVYGLPLISVYIFVLIMRSAFQPEPHAAERTLVLEDQNAKDR